MSYSLRQVQHLLTKPELELFQASRAPALAQLNPRQLTGKITRARSLRDKYRDTYRRQTVVTQTGPAGARKQMGGENNRTEVKAEIMAEVLQRFEAQHAKSEARQAKARRPAARAHNAPGVPTTKTNPKAAQRSRRSDGTASAGGEADQPMRGATTTKQRQVQRRDRAAEDTGYAVVSARGAKSSRAGASTVRPAVKTPTKKKATGGSARNAITGAAKPAAKLVKQVRQAVKRQAGADAADAAQTPRRAIRAKVGGSPSDNAKGAVPTNMPAVAQRYNPLKAEPVNKKIHASQRGRKKTFEATRDGR